MTQGLAPPQSELGGAVGPRRCTVLRVESQDRQVLPHHQFYGSAESPDSLPGHSHGAGRRGMAELLIAAVLARHGDIDGP